MDAVINIFAWMGFVFFWGGFLAFCLVFAGYPGFLFVRARLFSRFEANPPQQPGIPHLCISLLVVFRNGKDLLEPKIDNFLSLDYPKSLLELVLVSDGSDDGSQVKNPAWPTKMVKWFHFDAHQGKIACLNFGVRQCSGQIVVFSDVDAILQPNSIKNICRHFSDPGIGGVCGRRVVAEHVSRTDLEFSQNRYIGWDTMIKALEIRNGISITSHDGKVIAIRKDCFQTVADAVTDDAFIALSVISQGKRFVFDKEVTAQIKMPSRNPRHELLRRKRIVSQSLNGLKIHRRLLNPFSYGLFSIGLFINKVLRRLLPVALISMLVSSFALWALGCTAYGLLFVVQLAGVIFFLSFPLISPCLSSTNRLQKRVKRLIELGYFFLLGMAGSLWGLFSFVRGEKVAKWNPVKK